MVLSPAQPGSVHPPADLSESEGSSLPHLGTREGQATTSGPGSQSTEGKARTMVLLLQLRTMFEASAQQPFLFKYDDDNCCSGFPSPMDVPTRPQATARESGRESLRLISALAASLAAPSRGFSDRTAAAAASASSAPDRTASGCCVLPAVESSSAPAASSYAEWEVLQDQLLVAAATAGKGGALQPATAATAAEAEAPSTVAEGSPAASSFGCWGEALWCFNPACTNLSGPSELALKTLVCGGGCGVRYCSPECQAQGWRDGHRLSCGRLRDMTVASEGAV